VKSYLSVKIQIKFMKKELAFLLTFFVLAARQAFAQDLLATISSLLTSFVGVIFILIFILILLAVGGVLPKPKGRLPLGLILFLVLIALLFVIPQFVQFPQYLEVPESFKAWDLGPGGRQALKLIGLPEDWAHVPAIIYLFILPFAAIYTIVWAFLVMLGIFPQANINRILALVITFMTIPMGWFTKMVWVLFSFMGAWSIAVFAGIFIVGVFYRGAGIVTKEHIEYKKYIQMGKKGLSDVIKRLEEVKKGTVGQMRQEANYAISAAQALNIGARALQNLHMAANPQTPDQDVPKYIDEAIKELKKEL
jgi:hypothetical protein